MDLLDALHQLGNLVRSPDGQRNTLIIMPARSAHPMQVNINIDIVLPIRLLRRADIDDEHGVPDVDAPCHDVRAEQDIGLIVLEFSHDELFVRVGQLGFLSVHVHLGCD